jgi:hypothetical protein
MAGRPSSGLLQKVVRVHAEGPLLKAHLGAYGAKLAMALYREHVETPLPLDGAIWCQFALNAGMTQEHLNDRTAILPMYSTLRQGKKNVIDQFGYRYNSDERTVVAAGVGGRHPLALPWSSLFGAGTRPDRLCLPRSWAHARINSRAGAGEIGSRSSLFTAARAALRAERSWPRWSGCCYAANGPQFLLA